MGVGARPVNSAAATATATATYRRHCRQEEGLCEEAYVKAPFAANGVLHRDGHEDTTHIADVEEEHNEMGQRPISSRSEELPE